MIAQWVAIIALFSTVVCGGVVAYVLIRAKLSDLSREKTESQNKFEELRDNVKQHATQLEQLQNDTGRNALKNVFVEIENLAHELRLLDGEHKALLQRFEKIGAKQAQILRDEKRRAKKELKELEVEQHDGDEDVDDIPPDDMTPEQLFERFGHKSFAPAATQTQTQPPEGRRKWGRLQ